MSQTIVDSLSNGPEDKDLEGIYKRKKEEADDQALIAWVKQKYGSCKTARGPIEAQWRVNLSMYKGDQNIGIVDGKIIRVPQNSNRVRININRIRPAIRTLISRYTSQKPTASCIPASNEDEDLLSAEAAEALWDAMSERESLQQAKLDAAFWTANTGVGYIKTEWDNSAFDPMANPDDNMEPQGSMGDVRYTAPTPFNVFVPNLLETSIERQPYIFHATTMPLQEARDMWPDKITKDHIPSVIGESELIPTASLNLKGSPGNSDNKADSCLILEAWVKPHACPLMPKGGLVRMVDGVIVYKDTEKLPYEHGEYPLAKWDGVPSGTFYASSVTEDLIMAQREYNRTRSQIAEISNRMGNPGYFVQEGSVDTSKWSSRPGLLIPVKPGFQDPRPIQTPPVPSHLYNNLDIIKTDIEDISGQHQVSKGVAPSGVTAATAISFLQEQDQSFESSTYQSIEMAMEKIAKQSVALCVQYWDEPRLVKTIGRDQTVSIKYLTKADIRSGTDIRIISGSSMPQSTAAYRAYITDLIGRGIIPADKGLEMLNMPNMKAYMDLIKIDENHASRENIKLQNIDPEMLAQIQEQIEMQKQEFMQQQGFQDEMQARMDPQIAQYLDQLDQPVMPINDWDNHEVHIFMHEKFMKSQAFDMLEPSVQEEFKKHREAHLNKQNEKMLTDLMKNGVTNPEGEGGGEPGSADMQALMEGAAGPGDNPASTDMNNNPGGANQFSGAQSGLDGAMPSE